MAAALAPAMVRLDDDVGIALLVTEATAYEPRLLATVSLVFGAVVGPPAQPGNRGGELKTRVRRSWYEGITAHGVVTEGAIGHVARALEHSVRLFGHDLDRASRGVASE